MTWMIRHKLLSVADLPATLKSDVL
jgi:hypothetical protein